MIGATIVWCVVAGLQSSEAAETWGGSVGITSDYLVRGVSRSDHDPALQADLHVNTSSGWLAGLFTSSVRIVPGGQRNAEVGLFGGFSWRWNDDWRSKALLTHYRYPWNHSGSAYNYTELSFDTSFQDWLSIGAVYSPNASRYVPYYGLVSVTAKSAEVNLNSPAWHKLSVNAGIGYSHFAGPESGGYGYWSVGCTYDWAPVTLSAAFVDTSAAARDLVYDNAAQHRVIAAVVWRF